LCKLAETKTWLTKAHNRKLLAGEDYDLFIDQINEIGIKLNNYINSTSKASA